jgi:hypothetical protein
MDHLNPEVGLGENAHTAPTRRDTTSPGGRTLTTGRPRDDAPQPSAADLADFDAWVASLDAVPSPDDQEADDFPRTWTVEERRRFQEDVAEFYRTNPGA